MKRVGSASRGFLALFVDDGSLAVAVLAWLAIAGLLLDQLPVAEEWQGGVLFAGIAAILFENAGRAARRGR